MVKKSNSFGQL